jgi:uncharacterized Zn-finger protein
MIRAATVKLIKVVARRSVSCICVGMSGKMGHPTCFSEMQRRKADEVTPAFHMKI